MKNMLADSIQAAFKQLGKSGLADASLKSYQSSAFQPIKDLYGSKDATFFNIGWLTGLEVYFKIIQIFIGRMMKK